MALRARDQILGPFWDSDFGGTYWSVDCEGRPLETKKQIYSIAFAIYGLSELYRASGDELALQKAVELYQVIEEHSLDPVCGGYFEAFRRDWSPIEDMRLSDKDQNVIRLYSHLFLLSQSLTSLPFTGRNATSVSCLNVSNVMSSRTPHSADCCSSWL